jgi:hypothetical protein
MLTYRARGRFGSHACLSFASGRIARQQNFTALNHRQSSSSPVAEARSSDNDLNVESIGNPAEGRNAPKAFKASKTSPISSKDLKRQAALQALRDSLKADQESKSRGKSTPDGETSAEVEATKIAKATKSKKKKKTKAATSTSSEPSTVVPGPTKKSKKPTETNPAEKESGTVRKVSVEKVSVRKVSVEDKPKEKVPAAVRKIPIASKSDSPANSKGPKSETVRRILSRESPASLKPSSIEDLTPVAAALQFTNLLTNLLQNDLVKPEGKGIVSKHLIGLVMGGLNSLKAPEPPKKSRKKSAEASSSKISAQPKIEVIPGRLEGKAEDIHSVDASSLKLVPLEKEQPPVPNVQYGLERVLFNPGVYYLRDLRSRVYNFDPYLSSIMPVKEFDFSALKEYITSSRDETLISAAVEEGKKYTGSTSSMTSAISHFHYLLSAWRPPNFSNLSKNFPLQYESYTGIQRAPSAIFLRWRNGTYAIDADKEFDTATVLMMLGKSMEKLLTLKTDEFERYRRKHSSSISEEERNEPESFHYTSMGDFLMRSQLDAYDSRLPGSGMFDLKTRAVASIRMDAKNYEQGLGYEIKSSQGEWESYEREYHDMIRAAFLKYSLQVRMGRMDGIFVAYHNTERIFGFQYISLEEMDTALHGTNDRTLGDAEFKVSLALLNAALDRATKKYPEQSLRLHFHTRESASGGSTHMNIFAEPMTEEMIQQIQETNKAQIAEYERELLGLHADEHPEKLQQIVDESEADIMNDADAVAEDLEDDDVELVDKEEDAEAKTDADTADGAKSTDPEDNILGMRLDIRNYVNGAQVLRPINLKDTDDWRVDYKLSTMIGSKKLEALEQAKKKRRQALTQSKMSRYFETRDSYAEALKQKVKEGREWRKKEDELDAQSPIHVLGDEVFGKNQKDQ